MYKRQIDKLLNNFAPKEVLFERGKRGMFEGNFGSKFFTFELDDWVFNESSSNKMRKYLYCENGFVEKPQWMPNCWVNVECPDQRCV